MFEYSTPRFKLPTAADPPRTPTKPQWVERCEEARSRSIFPADFTLVPGSKKQDRLVVDCRGGCSLWAVFDGHIADDVAIHAARSFPGLLWSSSLWPRAPAEALAAAMQACHEAARLEELKGGSTAVVVVSTAEALWCCSAGDSRAVLGLRGGGFERMSVDHRADVPEEMTRIAAQGARLEWGRLGGVLPMTRGLGNFGLEAHGFTWVPHVSSVPLSEVDFVVVASDGIWDVISDEVCCAFVRQWSHVGIAERLAAYARRLGSVDDIAAVVVHVEAGRGAVA